MADPVPPRVPPRDVNLDTAVGCGDRMECHDSLVSEDAIRGPVANHVVSGLGNARWSHEVPSVNNQALAACSKNPCGSGLTFALFCGPLTPLAGVHQSLD